MGTGHFSLGQEKSTTLIVKKRQTTMGSWPKRSSKKNRYKILDLTRRSSSGSKNIFFFAIFGENARKKRPYKLHPKGFY